MIEIREVKSRKEKKLFATFPLKLYKGCPYYVPSIRDDEMNTFNPKKNFNLEHSVSKGFLAYKDGKLVGRIAGIINKSYNDRMGKKYIRFSRFECVDDIDVFKSLLGAVENFGKENGMEIIHGPWGFNDTDREGMLTYGFDKRSTYATNYYYEYFHNNMEKLGFSDESKWLERKFVVPDVPYEKIEKLAERVKQKYNLVDVAETLTIRQMMKRYGKKIFDTINESYGNLDGYIPVEGKVLESVVEQFGMIANRKFVSVLVNEKDEVAGFGIVLPSICKPLVRHKGRLFPIGFLGVLKSIKKPHELEMALIGIRKEYRNSGINAIIIAKMQKNIISSGIKLIESNPMLESNYDIQHQWKFSENDVIKKRQTYQKEIGSLIS